MKHSIVGETVSRGQQREGTGGRQGKELAAGMGSAGRSPVSFSSARHQHLLVPHSTRYTAEAASSAAATGGAAEAHRCPQVGRLSARETHTPLAGRVQRLQAPLASAVA